MICVVDYGMGNLRSVSKAIEALGGHVTVSDKPSQLKRASKLVFPGVGEFGQAMKELERRHLIEPIQHAIQKKKPFLGICLGLQLLFDSSEESRGAKGLSIIPGKVCKLPRSREKLKIPHMGWNQVEFQMRSKLTRGVKNHSYFYFVHSYYGKPKNVHTIAGTTQYGIEFPAMIEREPLFAVQFHPEKSQSAGLTILKNFISY